MACGGNACGTQCHGTQVQIKFVAWCCGSAYFDIKVAKIHVFYLWQMRGDRGFDNGVYIREIQSRGAEVQAVVLRQFIDIKVKIEVIVSGRLCGSELGFDFALLEQAVQIIQIKVIACRRFGG